jgi:hypothetical protein
MLVNDEVEVVRQWRLILVDPAPPGTGAAQQLSRVGGD